MPTGMARADLTSSAKGVTHSNPTNRKMATPTAWKTGPTPPVCSGCGMAKWAWASAKTLMVTMDATTE